MIDIPLSVYTQVKLEEGVATAGQHVHVHVRAPTIGSAYRHCIDGIPVSWSMVQLLPLGLGGGSP